MSQLTQKPCLFDDNLHVFMVIFILLLWHLSRTFQQKVASAAGDHIMSYGSKKSKMTCSKVALGRISSGTLSWWSSLTRRPTCWTPRTVLLTHVVPSFSWFHSFICWFPSLVLTYLVWFCFWLVWFDFDEFVCLIDFVRLDCMEGNLIWSGPSWSIDSKMGLWEKSMHPLQLKCWSTSSELMVSWIASNMEQRMQDWWEFKRFQNFKSCETLAISAFIFRFFLSVRQGLIIIGDGLQFITVLKTLKQAWITDGMPEDTWLVRLH